MKDFSLKGLSTKELLEKVADPEFQEQLRKGKEENKRQAEASRKEQVTLIRELEGVGVLIKTIWDLVNTGEPYPQAIPILLRHMRRPYMDLTKEGIARALAVPEAAYAWDELYELFDQEQDLEGNGLKWGIGCALSVYARKTKRYEDTLAILRNQKHGMNRLALLDVLAESRKPEIRAMIEEFQEDPDLKIQVNEYLTRWAKRKKRREQQLKNTR